MSLIRFCAMDTCLIFHQQPSGMFWVFFANHDPAAALLNRLLQKAARQFHTKLQGLTGSAWCTANRILKKLHLGSHLPILHACSALCSKSREHGMLKALWIVDESLKTFQRNRLSQSYHNPPQCALRIQNITLNTPQRNLQLACVLMNKDVRADSAVTGNEQLSEQMHYTGMEDTIRLL